MSRYFFDFRQGADLATDHEGVEFPDMEEAYLEAYAAAQDMWSELLKQRRDPTLCHFEVRDSERRLLFTLPFQEVMDACRDRKLTSTRVMRAETIATSRYAHHASTGLFNTLQELHRTLRVSRALLDQEV
jgi:hypothetical protein